MQKYVSLQIGVLTWNGAKKTQNSPEVGSILGQPVSYPRSYKLKELRMNIPTTIPLSGLCRNTLVYESEY